MKLVGSGLGDCVDQQSTEIPLTDIERGEQHLVLLHRVERDALGIRLAARPSGGADAEDRGS